MRHNKVRSVSTRAAAARGANGRRRRGKTAAATVDDLDREWRRIDGRLVRIVKAVACLDP